MLKRIFENVPHIEYYIDDNTYIVVKEKIIFKSLLII